MDDRLISLGCIVDVAVVWVRLVNRLGIKVVTLKFILL